MKGKSDMKPVQFGALFAATALVTACGGGVDPAAPTPQERVASDRVEKVIRSADTLLLPKAVLLLGDETTDFSFSCSESRCTVNTTGDVLTLNEVIPDLSGEVIFAEGTTYERQGGFDTVSFSDSDFAETIVDEIGTRVVDVDSAQIFGFWGDHGMALSGTAEFMVSGSEDVPITFATGIVLGTASGTYPATSATWRGIASGYDAAGRTGSGTAKLTVDLADPPTVNAEVRLEGSSIGSSAWRSIPLAEGRFETGTAADDRIVGNFLGPDHEEAWGTFDTRDWSGVFGAKK